MTPGAAPGGQIGSREDYGDPYRRTVAMFTYSKLAQTGIAAVSYLAANGGDGRLIGSGEIAGERGLTQALVAKVLTQLSAAGLVNGRSGPAGGYRLARDPATISLFDVVRVFEDPESQVMCPFGPDWCGVGPHCPLHDTFAELRGKVIDRLTCETFAQFVPSPAPAAATRKPPDARRCGH